MNRLETVSTNTHRAPRLVVAISSHALFDLDQANQVFEEEGEEAYSRHQIDNEGEPLSHGVAFPLAKKLLALKGKGTDRVEVILISRNSADTGLRIFNSIRHHNLDITRAAFTRGESPYRYISAFGTRDLGYDGAPFAWSPERPALLRAELDAYYARLYGLTRDELRYILDPADIYGDDYPSETFRVLESNETRLFGEYRTRRLVLEASDRLFEKH